MQKVGEQKIMPNRTIKIAVDASSKTTVKVNWKSIVGAAGNGAKAIFSPIMPANVNTASSMAGAMKDLRDASRLSKTSEKKKKRQSILREEKT